MSVTGEIKEAADVVTEELNLRNEGRVEDGNAPKTTEPGTGHAEMRVDAPSRG